MGLTSYFMPKKRASKEKAPVSLELDPTSGDVTGTQTPATGSHPVDVAFLALKCDLMTDYLHQQQQQLRWTSNGHDEGVVMKKSKNLYTCCPALLNEDQAGFMRSVELLNVKVAMTLNTPLIKRFMGRDYVNLSNGQRLQVLPDMSYLSGCAKYQFAAFIADRGQLVVWDDDPRHIIERATQLERELLDIIWQADSDRDFGDKKEHVTVNALEMSSENSSTDDLEASKEVVRPVTILQPLMSGLTLCLAFAAFGAGFAKMAVEVAWDGSYTRLAILAVFPLMLWTSLFFYQSIIGSAMQLFGPIKQVVENTKFYSGVAPARLRRDRATGFPHITIQMPVYKEGLEAVIVPTIRSIKAAISTYEMQGGTANIFVNDDGMQLLDEDLRTARQEFYEEHNIGWVARPKHNPKPVEGSGETPFLRRGRFKKASNMNYAMWVSTRVEDVLAKVTRDEHWTTQNESDAYRAALQEVVNEDEGRTWADGNIRIGDYILIIDSDTRVPKDCFLDCVGEMEDDPRVAILQYASGVMNITDNFFERGITFFTNLVYTQIRYAVASGDVAPFVGHNAVLRWEALQYISYDDDEDAREKWWSEETVSEDFDMALRLQIAGYLVRLAGYASADGTKFQEGVSLTVYDELTRWEKYAYGCSELVFQPFRYWFTRGPFTKLFRKFIMSGMPLSSKFTIMAYVGTYFALASAWILTLMNYFMVGWFNGRLDHYYLNSFSIYIAIVFVFIIFGNVSLAVMRFRSSEKGLISSVLENLKWIPLMTIFLGGVSTHVSQAILCHLFGLEISWGSTNKEAENITFFEEIPRVAKRFKFTFAFCIICAAMMVVLAQAGFVPDFWKINTIIAIWPLGSIIIMHFLLPIALNHNLMLFTW